MVGESPNFTHMERFVHRNWNQVVKSEVFLYEDGFYIVKFQSPKDRDDVLCSGPYTFNNKPIILRV